LTRSRTRRGDRGRPRCRASRTALRRRVAILAIVLLVAACSGGTRRSLSGSSDLAASKGEATVTIALDDVTAPAGAMIRGEAVIDNRTGHTVTLDAGTCNGSTGNPGWISVGLTNGRVGATPPHTLAGCPPFVVPVGTTRYPISVPSRYLFCNTDPSKATVQVPPCRGPKRFPPLPAGRYHTVVWVQSPLRVANSVNILLTPASP
jgi:hypothetical protein